MISSGSTYEEKLWHEQMPLIIESKKRGGEEEPWGAYMPGKRHGGESL